MNSSTTADLVTDSTFGLVNTPVNVRTAHRMTEDRKPERGKMDEKLLPRLRAGST